MTNAENFPYDINMTDVSDVEPAAMDFYNPAMTDSELVQSPRNLKRDATKLRRYADESATEVQRTIAVEVGLRVMHEAANSGWELTDDCFDWYDEDIVNIAQIVVEHGRWAKKVERDIEKLGKTFEEIFAGTYNPAKSNSDGLHSRNISEGIT